MQFSNLDSLVLLLEDDVGGREQESSWSAADGIIET